MPVEPTPTIVSQPVIELVTGYNLNDLRGRATYSVLDPTNGPTVGTGGGRFFVNNVRGALNNATYIQQIAYDIDEGDEAPVWARTRTPDGVWSTWVSTGGASTGAGYYATSTTTENLGAPGSKTLVIQTGLDYAPGLYVRAVNSANPAQYMEGPVDSYATATGILVFTSEFATASTSVSTWVLGIAGDRGAAGTNGTNGTNGAAGAPGAGYQASSTSTETIANTGAKALTVQPNLAYSANVRVRFAADASNYMDGKCLSYNPGTGLLAMTADFAVGSGTFSSWTVNVTGEAAGPTGAAGKGYDATSTSTETIAGTGAKSITIQPNRAYVVGGRVRVANGANFMEGEIDAYDTITGVLDFSADYAEGSGSFSAWTVSVAGARGATGPVGPSGGGGAPGAGVAYAVNTGGDQIIAQATLADITGLSFTGAANKAYHVKIFVHLENTSTALGIKLGVDGANVAASAFAMGNTTTDASANGSAGAAWSNLKVGETPATFSANTRTIGSWGFVEGTLIMNGTGGVVTARLATESSNPVTLKGSLCFLQYQLLN